MDKYRRDFVCTKQFTIYQRLQANIKHNNWLKLTIDVQGRQKSQRQDENNKCNKKQRALITLIKLMMPL